jgi:hypothetical protein
VGFTRFWYRKDKEVKQTKFDFLVADLKVIIAKSGVTICGPTGEGEPVLTPDLISFNGEGTSAHESFYFPRKIPDNHCREYEDGIFFFCKTALKPYDRVVAACLIAAKHWWKDKIKISADGDDECWYYGMGLYTAATGCQAMVPVDREKEALK